MLAPGELVPGREPPAPIELVELGRGDGALLADTWLRIGAPHEWSFRTGWSPDEWEAKLARPDERAWLARVDGDTAGLLELEFQPDGAVGIVVFGLVPAFVGCGYGGAFLTLATELAWNLGAQRVWLQTSSRDHPHALPNYERRGFRIFCAFESA
ncbi:MAG TPA: GNAT family N-acetyltransferase [Gaiellaceae bacterium]|nr:GNAT family N-acetyltransferase [Gaiellaceae bacterium]